MTQYILRRLLFLPVVLIGVTLITFLLLELIPGDPATVMLGDEFDARMAAELERAYGLDKPLPVRYVKFLANGVRLDCGRSIRSGSEIRPVLIGRLAFTVQLALLSLILSIIVGLLAGVVAATRGEGGRPEGTQASGYGTASSISRTWWRAAVINRAAMAPP